MTPAEWKAANLGKPVAEVVRRSVTRALPKELREHACDDILMRWVWHACACAATWTKERDPNHLERLSDTVLKGEGVKKIQTAVQKLRRELKAFPKLAQGAAEGAILALHSQGVDLKGIDGKLRPVDHLFDLVLQALHDGVAGPIPGVKSGPFWHRTTHGCLSYSKPLEGQAKLPGADTMLLFSLVLFFRFRSSGGTVLQEGQPMPAEGKPNYGLAVEIVNVVFPDSAITSDLYARNILHNLLLRNEVGLVSWPHEK